MGRGSMASAWYIHICVLVLVLSLGSVSASRPDETNRNSRKHPMPGSGLRDDYYARSCPRVEKIIFKEIATFYKVDKLIAPGILRMSFHDCFVRGCDCSLLLKGDNTERMSFSNAGLYGFEALNAAKDAVENACPGVVSCSDVLQYAARDAVILAGGFGWKVPAGRRDGTISRREDANSINLPSPRANATKLIELFESKGLTLFQMVVLSGAHTIGKATCLTFDNRLHSAIPDPSVDPYPPNFKSYLKSHCPKPRMFDRVNMDSTPEKFDCQYFNDLVSHRGLLSSDQTLMSDARTRSCVYENRDDRAFKRNFGEAMVAMSKIGVLTGKDGEIRRRMEVVNS